MRTPGAVRSPVADVIERQLGLDCGGVRAQVIDDVVERTMMRAGEVTTADYASRLERDPAALEDLAEGLRVPETYFLRETEQLEVLTRQVLPELAAARPSRPLRIWSAGCASGEEAYSLAIALELAGIAGRGRILATDRSAAALRTGERGEYGRRSLRNVGEVERQRYFDVRGGGRRVAVVDRLRDRVVFEQHDLFADPFPAGFDLIVCRNVLLYFTPEGGAALVGRLAAALAPGGWLVLGSTDPHHHAGTLLEPVRTTAGSLYRRADMATTPRRTRAPRLRSRPAAMPAPLPAPALPARTSSTASGAGTGPVPPTDVELPATIRGCELALAERPLHPETHVRHATLLLEAGQPRRARQAATAALFLSPDLASAHLVLGRVHLASGELADAARAFRNARDLLAAMPARADVPATDLPAGRLLAAAEAGLQQAEDRSRR